jgi:nicotinate-nucleotide pyrophosphorylase (carboxylating)
MRFPFQARVPDDYVKRAVKAALKEDIDRGDVTTASAVPAGQRTRAIARVKAKGVVAGLGVFRTAFKMYDPSTVVKLLSRDGDSPRKGSAIAEVRGKARSVLTCERVALNFLQHLSGIATETSRFVGEVRGTRTRIIDTRKTTPGLRLLEKYAVVKGGGFNHRPTLSDLIMIKDNHIKAAGGVRRAVEGARRRKRVLIEVEMAYGMDLRQLEDLRVDIVMLDNYPIPKLRRAISYLRTLPYKPYVEVSGGVHLGNVRKIAKCGPDFISVGYITHSAPALDIGLDFKGLGAGGRA